MNSQRSKTVGKAHPLIDEVLGMLQSRGIRDGGVASADRSRLARLLIAHQGRALEVAVRSLIDFAYYLDVEQGWPQTAQAIVEVAADAIDALESFSPSRSLERLHTEARRFERFTALAVLAPPRHSSAASHKACELTVLSRRV